MSQQIEKQLVRERFASRLKSYKEHAMVQQSMAKTLTELLFNVHAGHSFNRVLEVGSGTGILMADLLGRCTVDTYYANDLVEESALFLKELLASFPVREFHFLPGDIERMLWLPSELDLVVSNATVQWLDDLESFFRSMSKRLRRGGVLAFSSFSTSNMQEISAIAGGGLRYHSLHELEQLAGKYFELTNCREEVQRLEFASPEAVLHHIRQTGVNALSRRTWTKSQYKRFIDQYKEQFSCAHGVSLTYHPVYCCMKTRAS